MTKPREQLPIVSVFSIRDAIEAHGMQMSTRVVNVEVIEAGRQLAADLACLPGDEVVFVERLRVADGEPMVLDTAHLRAELFPGLEKVDFEHRSLYDVLARDYGRTVAEAQETLEPVILTPRECELLEVPPHTTALLTRRLTTDAAGVVVALGHVLLRGDRSRYIYKRTIETATERSTRPAIDGSARRPSRRTPSTTTTRRE